MINAAQMCDRFWREKATMPVLYYLTSACSGFMHYSTAGPGKVRARGQRCFQAKSGQKISVTQTERVGLIADYLSGQRFLISCLYLVTSSHVQIEALPPPSGSRRTGSLSANQGRASRLPDRPITAYNQSEAAQSREALWRCLKPEKESGDGSTLRFALPEVECTRTSQSTEWFYRLERVWRPRRTTLPVQLTRLRAAHAKRERRCNASVLLPLTSPCSPTPLSLASSPPRPPLLSQR